MNTDRPETRDEQQDSTEAPTDVTVRSTFIEGDDARDAFPTEIEAALRYAEENQYEYGPKLRDADLQWEINGVETMGDGIARVFIDYTPSTSFPRLIGI